LGATLLLILENHGLTSAITWLILSYACSGMIGFVTYRSLPLNPQALAPPCALTTAERWRRALTFVAIAASVYVLLQAERLVIPQAMSLADLATFAVAWSVVGSPYKLITAGIGFALMPRLRAASSAKTRRKLVLTELRLAVVLGAISAVLLIPFGKLVIEQLYGAKYEVTIPLITAIVLSGLVRLTYGVASAMITALAEGRELRVLNWSGWLTTAVAILLAFALSGYGLVGVVVGVTLGWLSKIIIVFLLLGPSLLSKEE
jgi:O-antigen/teichoic acid export membrane protein